MKRLCSRYCCRQQLLPFSPAIRISTQVRDICCSTQPSDVSMLQQVKDIKPLKQVHARIIVSDLSEDVFVCNRLMNAYAGCRVIAAARVVFSQIAKKNLVSWTILVSGLTKNGLVLEAIEVFYEMVAQKIKPNEVTVASVLPAFGKLGISLIGKSLHSYWIRQNFEANVIVETGLIDMYSKFGCMRTARNMFDNMSLRNVVSWNAIISGYSENGFGEEAVTFFNEMRSKGISYDIFTLMSLVSLLDFNIGSGAHGLIVKSGYDTDRLLRTALMELYINFDFFDSAYSIFGEINKKDLVSWTLMLRGFLKSGNWKSTIEHFNNMIGEDEIKLDSVSFTTILTGCSSSGALHQGRRIHTLMTKSGFEADKFAGSALIDMYANCAQITDAERFFRCMREKDVVCWNTMISAYGLIAFGNEAISVFSEMMNEGVIPDESTFVAVLHACSHSGLVDQGLEIFNHMTQNWNIIPNSKHYSCVVDLLSRAGRIVDAYILTKSMHLEPGLEVYASLLNSCIINKNVEIGVEVSSKLLQLNPNDAGYYVLISNMYALSGNMTCARTARQYLKSNNLMKNPGVSSIEIGGEMFTFMASQMDHPHYAEIKEFLMELIFRIKEVGYEPDVTSVLLDVADDVKKDILFHHSEKLAIAFGLMRTKPGMVIRITKNLRICKDCHSASKLISKVYGRVLAIKDANRFHVFQDGVCSCNDWW